MIGIKWSPKFSVCQERAVSQKAVPSHKLDLLKQFSPEAEAATQEKNSLQEMWLTYCGKGD